MRIRDWIFGPHAGATNGDLEKLVRRESFSEFLPWIAFDDEQKRYLNADESMGYLWECTPLAFAGESQMDTLETILNYDFPRHTILQVILFGDPDITDYINKYLSPKGRDSELGRRTINEFSNFILNGTAGLEQMFGTPVRNFRCFFALKTPEDLDLSLLANFEQNLSSLGLQPRLMEPVDLLKFMRRMFNRNLSESEKFYDPYRPIRKQVINGETIIKDGKQSLRIGPEDNHVYIRCLTPKALPLSVDSLDANELAGFVRDSVDSFQLRTPFLWSINIIFDSSVETQIHQKASVTNAQQSTGSFSIQIRKRSEEFTWALSQLSDKKRFVRIVPSLVIFGRTEQECLMAAAAAKSVWQKKKYIIQEESILRRSVFLFSLPFGFYPTKANLTVLERDFSVPIEVASRLIPIQADFRGTLYDPALLLLGMKGQLIGVNVFSKLNNNHNFLMAAESGSGKTFFVNMMLFNHYLEGAKIRVVDIGYGYQKMCRILGGTFLDFGEDNVVINPFHSNAQTDEDIKSDYIGAANVVGEMVYSSSKNELDETEATLLFDAVMYAFREDPINGIDAVCRYLAEFPKYASEELQGFEDIARNHARRMAFNLSPFRRNGVYGRYFNGPTTFDIKNDDFVVLELEKLTSKRDLMGVVIMQVLNAITQDLYLSDRGSRRFILFEEAWSFFDGRDRVGKVIVEGYRRARRYQGAFGIVTQSMLDTLAFGEAGTTIRHNSATKFMLQSTSYPEAHEKGVINAPGLMLEMLQNLKKINGHYSEVFVDTPFGKGVGRLVVDPWNYWLATSSGADVNRFMRLMEEHNDVVKVLEIVTGISENTRQVLNASL
jgi:conjugal transfer ATP-binding protein TraC